MMYVRSSKEIRQRLGFIPRNLFRYIALNSLSLKDHLFFDSNLFNTPRIHFLYFHHVFDDEAKNFEKLVCKLSQNHTFISHSEAVNRIITNTIDKPYISWSSDDGFKNNLTAAEILSRYNAKAIFFLNPESIGLESPQDITAFCKERLQMPPIEFLNWAEVELLQKKGHEIGSHSMGHYKMNTLEEEQIREELYNSKKILTSYCGDSVHFAYPFGNYQDFHLKAYELVFETGYKSCASAKRGCHYPLKKKVEADKLLLRRDQITAYWPLSHLQYVISRGARKLVDQENRLPKIWNPLP